MWLWKHPAHEIASKEEEKKMGAKRVNPNSNSSDDQTFSSNRGIFSTMKGGFQFISSSIVDRIGRSFGLLSGAFSLHCVCVCVLRWPGSRPMLFLDNKNRISNSGCVTENCLLVCVCVFLQNLPWHIRKCCHCCYSCFFRRRVVSSFLKIHLFKSRQKKEREKRGRWIISHNRNVFIASSCFWHKTFTQGKGLTQAMFQIMAKWW